MNVRAMGMLGAVIALALPLVLPASAQKKDAQAQLRTVHGGVVDKNDTPVPGSIVYLLNVKTQAVTTHFADDAGNYRFSGLDPNVDYEVHAEHGDMMSGSRTISSFDTRRDIDYTLKLSRKKESR